jgi:hypothetical protein
MREAHELNDIAEDCSDVGELAVKVEMIIHAGDEVSYEGINHHYGVDMEDAIDSLNGDDVFDHFVSIKLNNPPNPVFVGKLDEAITALSVEVASHYQGKFDE